VEAGEVSSLPSAADAAFFRRRLGGEASGPSMTTAEAAMAS